MTDTVTRQPATDFGIGFADQRDRNIDWWNLRDDLPTADQSILDDRLKQEVAALLGVSGRSTKTTRLVVDMDLLGPAKNRSHVNTGFQMPMTCAPDYFEDGKAWWITEYGVVGFDSATWSQAANVAFNHGTKARMGKLPTDYGFTVLDLDEAIGEFPAEHAWPAGMGRRNYAYTLWTIVDHAVTKED